MEINRKLNLVQTIETDNGSVYLHSTPISREVWENYFLILSKTYSQLFAQGLHQISGPVVAGLMLKRLAQLDGVWDGSAGVEKGLLPEIRRLTNVVVATGAGWQTLPIDTALARGVIDQETMREAEGAIVFFICASAVLSGPQARKKLTIMRDMTEALWGAQHTSLDVTEWADSLPTSTPDDNTGAKTPALLVPH